MIPLQWFTGGGHLSLKAPGRAWSVCEEGCRFLEDSWTVGHRARGAANQRRTD